MTLRAYKYRIYPTQTQVNYLNQVIGSVRFVWNQLVANFNSWSHEGPNRILNEKILKDIPEFSWLNESISYALQQKRIDFDETKKQFFNKCRKKKLGRMKFKSKGISRDSFRIPGQALNFNKCVDFEQSRIKLPKLTPIKIIIDRKFNGLLRSITVSKNSCNQYFVSVLIEEVIELKSNTGRSIGIDLGLIDLATLSNGMKIKNPKWFRESQTKLKKAQQHLSRKVKGSNRRTKARLKVTQIHNKISQQRSFLHHNLSTWLVENHDHILLENLNVAGMKKMFGKSISDAGFSSLVNMIKYKCLWYGKTFHQVDRFFPSSKLCSICGHKMNKEDMTLDVRDWKCPSCHAHHDRDLNAATNILHRGLKDLYNFSSDELADYRRGEAVRPEVSLPKASSVKRLVNFIDFDRLT